MAQLFPAGINIVVRTVLVAAVAFFGVASVSLWGLARSPAMTGQYRTYTQPVPFAHALHVNGFRIDCRYCHAGAERAAMAGLPPTAACVPCHSDSTLQSSLFAAVRQSLESGRPIPWRRVTSLPDFVFFNHAVHVNNGIGCDICHGPVERMQTVYQAAPLTMEWCMQCHRDPKRYVSVRNASFRGWTRGDLQRGRALVAEYDLARLSSCTTCHR
jgi:hypothetical protein